MAVYLLHIDPPLGRCSHYVGFAFTAKNVAGRVARHVAGKGSVMTREAVRRGSAITLVHEWPEAPREFERRLKGRKAAPRWCPACNPQKKAPEFIAEETR